MRRALVNIVLAVSNIVMFAYGLLILMVHPPFISFGKGGGVPDERQIVYQMAFFVVDIGQLDLIYFLIRYIMYRTGEVDRRTKLMTIITFAYITVIYLYQAFLMLQILNQNIFTFIFVIKPICICLFALWFLSKKLKAYNLGSKQ
jgi:hypothetical protein